MLTSIQRGDVVERLYMDARLAPLRASWDAYPGPSVQAGGFPGWLPGFYDEVECSARFLGVAFLLGGWRGGRAMTEGLPAAPARRPDRPSSVVFLLTTHWQHVRFIHTPPPRPPTYARIPKVLRVIEHESWWCSDVLPEHHPQLVLALLEKLLSGLAQGEKLLFVR